MKKILLCFLCLFILPYFSIAQNKIFDVQDIHLSNKVAKYKTMDLNDDSLKEIIVFTQYKKDRRTHQQLNILWQTAWGFTQETIQSFTPHQEIILFDFGDVSEDPGKEFVFLTKNGVYYYALDTPQHYKLSRKKLITVSSIFKNTDKDNVIYWDFVKDICGDQWDEIIIPQFNRYLIYSRTDSSGWELQSQLNLTTDTEISTNRITNRLSVYYTPLVLRFADCNQDGLSDILAQNKDEFFLFYQKPNGSFSQQPDLTFDMQFHTDEQKRGEEINIHQIKDINGDGLIDLLANKISARESIFNPQSQIQIYFGKPNQNRLWMLKPDQIIVASGIQFDEQLIDLNNDNKIDLAIPSIKLGLMRIIKMLLTKSVTMNIKIYQMNEMNKYPKVPDLEKNLTLKFNFSLGENEASGTGVVPVFDLSGDFNGDGYLDLISAANQRKFQIYFGKKKKIFSTTAQRQFSLQLPANGHGVQLFDLDGNGKTDIVMTYRKHDDKTGKMEKMIRILLNRM